MNVAKLLEKALSGNLENFFFLESVDHSTLFESSKELSTLILTKQAVLTVLEGMGNSDIQPETVQKWASFMRRGHINPVSGGIFSRPLSTLDIDYDPVDEDLIVEIISRLDEIGDEIDGVIDKAELENLVNRLN